jgi:hypothetical protein
MKLFQSRSILAATILGALSLPVFADVVATETTTTPVAPAASVTTVTPAAPAVSETITTQPAPVVHESTSTTTTTVEGTRDRHQEKEAAEQRAKAAKHEAKAQEHEEKAEINR